MSVKRDCVGSNQISRMGREKERILEGEVVQNIYI
jgi:hypothetical protein